MKKRIALTLTILILLNLILPVMPVSYANSLSETILNEIQNLEAYKTDIFNKNLLFNSSVSIEDIEIYLTQYGKKYPLLSDNGEYCLNPYVYKKYKVVAYTNFEAYNDGIAGLTNIGSPKKESQSITISGGFIDVKEVDEYRYLGYQKNFRNSSYL